MVSGMFGAWAMGKGSLWGWSRNTYRVNLCFILLRVKSNWLLLYIISYIVHRRLPTAQQHFLANSFNRTPTHFKPMKLVQVSRITVQSMVYPMPLCMSNVRQCNAGSLLIPRKCQRFVFAMNQMNHITVVSSNQREITSKWRKFELLVERLRHHWNGHSLWECIGMEHFIVVELYIMSFG